jgi:hypothetical protein
MAPMYGVKMTGALRVSHAGELEGLDIHEHGAPAYPEFVTVWGKSATASEVNGSIDSPSVPSTSAPVSAR